MRDMVMYKENGADAFYFEHHLLVAFASKEAIKFCKKSKNVYFFINNISLKLLIGFDGHPLRMIACNKKDKKAAKAFESYLHSSKR